jgi:hypothetical protein
MADIVMLASPENTLNEMWIKFAEGLRALDAEEKQVEAMKSAFYFGAAHVYARIDHACRDEESCTTFGEVMDEIFHEIDTVMKRRYISESVGHA